MKRYTLTDQNGDGTILQLWLDGQQTADGCKYVMLRLIGPDNVVADGMVGLAALRAAVDGLGGSPLTGDGPTTTAAITADALDSLADAISRLREWVGDHTPGQDHSQLADVRDATRNVAAVCAVLRGGVME